MRGCSRKLKLGTCGEMFGKGLFDRGVGRDTLAGVPPQGQLDGGAEPQPVDRDLQAEV